MVASAVVAGSVISGAGSYFGAKKQADAANNATNAQVNMFNQTQANLAPYMDVGRQLIPSYLNLLGAGPGGMGGVMDALNNIPGYAFQQQAGQRATLNAFGPRGLSVSPAAMTGAGKFSMDLAKTSYMDYLDRILQGVQVGGQAATGGGQIASGFAGPIGSSMMNLGNAQAAGIMGPANAIGSGIQFAGMYGSKNPYNTNNPFEE